MNNMPNKWGRTYRWIDRNSELNHLQEDLGVGGADSRITILIVAVVASAGRSDISHLDATLVGLLVDEAIRGWSVLVKLVGWVPPVARVAVELLLDSVGGNARLDRRCCVGQLDLCLADQVLDPQVVLQHVRDDVRVEGTYFEVDGSFGARFHFSRRYYATLLAGVVWFWFKVKGYRREQSISGYFLDQKS